VKGRRWGKLLENVHLEEQEGGGRINLRCHLRDIGCEDGR